MTWDRKELKEKLVEYYPEYLHAIKNITQLDIQFLPPNYVHKFDLETEVTNQGDKYDSPALNKLFMINNNLSELYTSLPPSMEKKKLMDLIESIDRVIERVDNNLFSHICLYVDNSNHNYDHLCDSLDITLVKYEKKE